MSSSESRSSRRKFLQQSGSVLAGLSIAGYYPTFFTPSGFGAEKALPPSERILIGCVGVGNQGSGNLGKVLKDTIAVCDVDSQRMGVAKERVEKSNGQSCAAYGDYRKLLDNKDIDAIVVTTPDPWHAL
ncbi:MAG: gfo/Idh/MocA family oxidoreductase, partial [Planctomycetales bacterium]